MKNNILKMTVLAGALCLSACTQFTPSMMSTSRAQLSSTTMMEQVPFDYINDATLSDLADHYKSHGTSALDLTMTFDPKSKSFTAMNAVHKLQDIKAQLKKKNVLNVTTQTAAIEKGTPSLLISYDMVQAMAPQNCNLMPGIETANTTRFIPDYKFGCSTETMLSRQIARPTDLLGTETMDNAEGRRAATVTESYKAGVQRTPISGGVERGDLVN